MRNGSLRIERNAAKTSEYQRVVPPLHPGIDAILLLTRLTFRLGSTPPRVSAKASFTYLAAGSGVSDVCLLPPSRVSVFG